MGESDPDDPKAPRPSFSAFWKRTKEVASKAKQVTFVSGSGPGRKSRSSAGKSAGASPSSAGKARVEKKTRPFQPYEDDDPDDANDDDGDGDGAGTGTGTGSNDDEHSANPPLTKAQIRRAQVRRAQVQHRKRKAEYMRQLELDVDTLRELITATEQETRVLRRDNEAIRVRLGLGPGGMVMELGAEAAGAGKVGDVHVGAAIATQSSAGTPADGSLFADIDIDALTVSLVMDEQIGTPVYQISSSSSAVSNLLSPVGVDFATPVLLSDTPAINPGLDLPLATLPPPDALPPLLPFVPELTTLPPTDAHAILNFILALEHVCWDHVGHQYCPPGHGFPIGGHSMMASSLVLSHAPPEKHNAVYANSANYGVDAAAAEASRELLPRAGQGVGSASGSGPDCTGISWQVPGVSLQSLYALATSLNPGVDQELTPIQAWFEMAARYPLAILLRPGVLEALKCEFEGVVQCLYYGAVLERGAYESVVRRVVDPLVVAEQLAQVGV